MSRLRESRITVVPADGYSPEQARREAEDWLDAPARLSDHIPLAGDFVSGGSLRRLPESVASIGIDGWTYT